MPGVQFDPGAVLDKVMMVTMMAMSMMVTMMTMWIMVDGKGDLCWGGRRRLLSLPIGGLQVTTSILNIIIIYHHHHHHCNLWGVFLCLASHLLHSANL